MESSDLKLLLEKYYQGHTTPVEENELKEYFNNTSDLSEDLKSDAALFKALAAHQPEGLDKFLDDDWLFEKIQQPDPIVATPHVLPLMKFLRVAASIILVAGTAFWIGKSYNRTDTNELTVGVENLQRELQDMKRALLTDGSASERIRVTSKKFDPVKDEQVIEILIETLNQDPNVNVRLAACEALYQFKKNSRAKEGLIKSLQNQTDPMVQIVLIEILSDIKDRESFQEIKRFKNKENLLPSVREKAEQGLSALREI